MELFSMRRSLFICPLFQSLIGFKINWNICASLRRPSSILVSIPNRV
ncbi:hypothetical protein C789_1561 [Microcystis aeruginosa FACHB-905 = DIANCHI905]|nr:hypothetical protein C789_1561 [Microcystis aeruginosa FACHB-905 = DIANCHI905]